MSHNFSPTSPQEEAAPPPLPPPPAGPALPDPASPAEAHIADALVMPAVLPISYSVQVGQGILRYYTRSRRMVAELSEHIFNQRTHLQRSCVSVRPTYCRGRPIGFLTAWLIHVDASTMSRETALYDFVPTPAQREAARIMFKALPGFAVQFMFRKGERRLLPGEPEEPEVVN